MFRALQLGDLLCAVPALRALRRHLPKASITLIGLPWAAAFAGRFGAYVDDFIAFPGFPGMPERPADVAALPGFLSQAQDRHFDLAIQLHGSGGLTNPLVCALGAREAAGFFVPGAFKPEAGRFIPWPDHLSEVRRLLALMKALGAPADDDAMEFPMSGEDRRAFAPLQAELALRRGRYVCVHAGARDPRRRWPAEHFAALADELHDRGFRVVLTGSAFEADVVRGLARAMRRPAIDVAWRDLPLGALAALLEGSRLLVTNDTGMSHLAAGLAVPSVVIFSATDPARWAPPDGGRHRAVDARGGTAIDAVRAAALAQLAPLTAAG